MSQRPFRFLHAADLHLDEPVEGLADAPGHLVELLIDCPLLAAKRVFDAAIEHHVDFVVLSGDVVDLRRAAPREMTFLVEQFQRLAQSNITVYWAGGEIDSADWPKQFSLPDTVKQASRLHVQRHRHEIAGVPVCELVGRSHDQNESPKAREFANSKSDLFSIAVVHLDSVGELGGLGIRYWALGGLHERSTSQQTPDSIAHCPGTPQARRPSESGAHGCTLVQVNDRGQISLTPLATDVVRWESQKLTLGTMADRAELERTLRDRTSQLVAEAAGAALLIDWTINCEGSIFAELRRGKSAAEMIDALNREFGHRSPAAWTVGLQPDLHGAWPMVWQREETLRGDYLRALNELLNRAPSSADAKGALVDLDHMLTHGDAVEQFQRFGWVSASLDDPAVRQRVLRQAAWLGADLLSVEEVV